MAKTLVRAAFAYDSDALSDATGLSCPEETLTNQSEKEECDINTLVARFKITGVMPQINRLPIQEDFVGLTDYKSAMDALVEAQDTFMELPAELRARFDHDAGKFVAFCSDEKNLPELRKLGLAVPEAAEAPPVRVVNVADKETGEVKTTQKQGVSP